MLSPLVTLAATVVAQMLLVTCRRGHRATLGLGLLGTAAAVAALLGVRSAPPPDAAGMLSLDGYALFFAVLIVLAAMVVMLLSYHELEGRFARPEEYYILLSLAVLGGVVLVTANHFATFFLGLELLSVSLYALIAYPRSRDRRALEAGMKYLILAGAASGFILFGMALVYAELGSLALPTLSGALRDVSPAVLTVAGVALMVVGIGFKLGVAPFHFWTPDVYEGAPTPVAGFLATVSKGAVFALLLRHFSPSDEPLRSALLTGVSVLAIASMLGGNLLALLQDNVKRVLGGSSIAHMGYGLVALVAGGRLAGTALAFYLLSYFIAMLGAFGVIALLSGEGVRADRIEDYRGLARSRPWLATALTAMLLSLAGIPLTAGFVGKFYVAAAGANAALWPLLGALVVGSVVGLFYYLRIIIAIYTGLGEEPDVEAPLAARPIPLVGGVLLSALTLLLVWLGVFPAPVLRLIEAVAQRL